MKQYTINAEAQQINVFDERWYQISDGEDTHYLPGVTTYLEVYPKGYAFRQWLKSTSFNADAVLEKAGEFGSQFHDLIQHLLLGESIVFQEDVRLWERFLIWCQFWKDLGEKYEVEFNDCFIEFIAHNIEYQCAGTVDFMPQIDGKYYVIDWKSGNYIADQAKIQISTYTKLVEAQYEVEVEEAWIGWFPAKKPNKRGYRIIKVERDEIETNFEDFQHLQKIWTREHGKEKPKFLIYPSNINLDFIKNNPIIKNEAHDADKQNN